MTYEEEWQEYAGQRFNVPGSGEAALKRTLINTAMIPKTSSKQLITTKTGGEEV
jgi:hypothetical protein